MPTATLLPRHLLPKHLPVYRKLKAVRQRSTYGCELRGVYEGEPATVPLMADDLAESIPADMLLRAPCPFLVRMILRRPFRGGGWVTSFRGSGVAYDSHSLDSIQGFQCHLRSTHG